MKGKKARLDALFRRIKRTLNGQTWFFPRAHSVAGWEGTDPVFFVALAPSAGNRLKRDDHGIDAPVKLLYDTLAKYGYGNSHLTDLVKQKVRTEEIDSFLADTKKLAKHKRWLLEEARILQPQLIVALDLRAKRTLRKWFPGRKIYHIAHYSYAYRGQNAVRAWSAGWRRVNAGE